MGDETQRLRGQGQARGFSGMPWPQQVCPGAKEESGGYIRWEHSLYQIMSEKKKASTKDRYGDKKLSLISKDLSSLNIFRI